MEQLFKDLQDKITNLLSGHLSICKIACVQRAKFEGWYKFELINSLLGDSLYSNVNIEENYPSNGRSDFSFKYNDKKWFVEMKTANTSYRSHGLENIIRPITMNMNNIAEDIRVLQIKTPPAQGLAIFCIFPVPSLLWNMNRGELNYHLHRIEQNSDLKNGVLRQTGFFVSISSNYGIANFLVPVLN